MDCSDQESLSKKISSRFGCQDVVIVGSVIHTPPGALSYTATRSAYSAPIRLNQTIETIESVRRHLPGAKIVFLEWGIRDIGKYLPLQKNDTYVYMGRNPLVSRAISSPHKGLGEAVGLIGAAPRIHAAKGGYYFKLSGRYAIEETFDRASFNSKGFTAAVAAGSMSTRLYGVHGSALNTWFCALALSLPSLMRGKGIEQILYTKLKKNLKPIRCPLGIRGNIGVDGTLIEE